MADFVEIAGPEEHKLRLECCKTVLQRLFDAGVTENCDQDNFDELFVYVTDVWSVIRKECAKALTQSYSAMLEVRQKAVLLALDLNFANVINDNLIWQKLDGCLLAYNAIVSSINDDLLLNSLSLHCFDLLGHMRIPIRDTAADLLIKLAAKSFDRRKTITDDTLTTIHTLTTSQAVETEQVVVKLGCLLSVYDSIAVHAVIQEDSLTLLYTCLASCMTHTASTVRQQAGHLLSNLLKSVENEHANNKLEQLIETVLQPALQSSQPWTFAESALIVMEEVLRSMTCVSSMQRLMRVLDGHWDDLMAHERFEVRRVILQLLPIFCRTLLLHSCDLSTLNLTGDKVKEGELGAGLSLLLRACRLSALLRKHRLLEECLSATSLSLSGGEAEPWIAVEQAWGSEPRGRLQEAEQQMLFKSSLLAQAVQPTSRHILLQQMVTFDAELVSSVVEVFKEVNAGHEHCNKDTLVALDLPELWTLATCFLQSLTTRTHATEQLLELKQQLEQARESMIQVLTSLQQLSGTSSTSSFEGQIENYNAILPPVSDPATNPSLYARHHHTHSASASASQLLAVDMLLAPDELTTTSASTASVVIATFSPPVTPSKPQRFSSPYGISSGMMMHSSSSLSVPKSPAPPSPNNLGPNCSLTLPPPPYSALDRWMCEAIAPLLPCLCQSAMGGSAVLLIAIGWTKRILTDPLWLDGRKFGKTALYDSLLLLSSSSSDDSESYEMIVQELLEVLNVAVMISTTAGDVLRVILIVLKSILAIISKRIVDSGTDSLHRVELEETLEAIKTKVQANHSSSSLNNTAALNSTKDVLESEEALDEDEFSDWDDDEDDDDIGMKVTAGSGGVSSANAMADAIVETVDSILLLVLK